MTAHVAASPGSCHPHPQRPPQAAFARSCGVHSPVVLCALATAVLPSPALAQETLPTIYIRKPKPLRHAAQRDVGARPVQPAQGAPGEGAGAGPALAGAEGGVAGQGTGAGVGNNGTEIGPGNNGQLCADGVCNDPKSYAAPIQSVGTKVNTAVMDTPVTTKTVTHQMLEDQQVITLDQALRNVSGVTTSGGGNQAVGNSFSRIMLRGFPTQNYFRDGFRIDSFGYNFAGAGSVEMANVESIEVLKGPAAILYGAVEPGGIVNINTKQPLDKPAYSIQQQIGSYANYRTSLDATGPLTQNKDLLYRFTMSYENDGSFRTLDYNRNLMFNPVVKWNIDANTWVSVSDSISAEQLQPGSVLHPRITTTSSRFGWDAATTSGRSRRTSSSRISPRSPGITTSTRTGRSSRPPS